jgi:hypothetical protein
MILLAVLCTVFWGSGISLMVQLASFADGNIAKQDN